MPPGKRRKLAHAPVLMTCTVRVDADTLALARALCTVIDVPLGDFAGRALKAEVESVLEGRDSEFRALVDAVMLARRTYGPEYAPPGASAKPQAPAGPLTDAEADAVLDDPDDDGDDGDDDGDTTT
jgi:hypothetical protein